MRETPAIHSLWSPIHARPVSDLSDSQDGQVVRPFWEQTWLSGAPSGLAIAIAVVSYLDLRSKMKIRAETWCMTSKIYLAKDLSHDDDGDGDGDDGDDQGLK